MNKTLVISILKACLQEAKKNNLTRYLASFDGASVHVAQTTLTIASHPYQVLVAWDSNEIELGFDLARALATPRSFKLNAYEKRLAANGQKIEAIKAVRQRAHDEGFSMGLKEAKDLVETVPNHGRYAQGDEPRCRLGWAYCKACQ